MLSRVSLLGVISLLCLVGCSSDSDSRFAIRNTHEYSVALREATELAREPLTRFASSGAISQEDEGQLVQAQLRYEALTEFQPTLFTLHFALGAVRHALGSDAEAEQSFRQALTLIPMTPTPDAARVIGDTHHGLAAVLIDRGNHTEARSEAKLALEYSPDDPNYLVTLAAAEIQLKDLVNAEKHLKQAVKFAPDNRRAKLLLGLIQKKATE